jgi:two-component system osmolarity sensor histidine kinase EnvZ
MPSFRARHDRRNVSANASPPKPARRRLDSLFARLLLAQAVVVIGATLLFAFLAFVNRSVALADPYAEILAPELVWATGGNAATAPPRSLEVHTGPDAPEGVRVTLMPGIQALMRDLGRRGVQVDDAALTTKSGSSMLWLRVRPEGEPSAATWVGVPGQPLLPTWSMRITLGIAAVLLFVGIASWAFARRVSRPLERLRRAIEAHGPGGRGDAATQASGPIEGVAEVVAIAAAHDALQARIRRYERERALLLGGVSHDLRSPLARIRLAAEMLPEREDNREGVQVIVREIEQADRLVGSFLDFVRAEALALDETVDLAALARGAAAAFDQAGNPPVVRAPHRLDYAPANALLLERVLTNLIDNAFKHGRAPVHVMVSGADDGVVLVVEDRGDGMTPDKALRMQEAFARGEGSRGVPGTGLGLSIVQQVTRRMGGQLSFERLEPGQRVSVRLPPAREAPAR